MDYRHKSTRKGLGCAPMVGQFWTPIDSYSSTLQTRIANGQDVEAPADLRKFLSIPRIWRTVAEIQKSDYLAHLKLLDGKRRAGMPEG